MIPGQASLLQSIREQIHIIKDQTQSYYPLLDTIGEAKYVLLGEATHGTQEFYQARSEITRLLIEEKGFNVIAIEADFPESYRINRFLRESKDTLSANWALDGFKRFPLWMWKNRQMLSFLENLKIINSNRSPQQKVSFYGLDLFSMYSSIEAVISYLKKADPEVADQAKKRYACFYQYGSNDDSYGQAMGYVKESCQREVVAQLMDLQSKKVQYLSKEGLDQNEELFCAEQNAILVKNAEQYYREMFNNRVKTWNIRDLYMANMVETIIQHVSKISGNAKIIIWAHNSHTGNALATEFSESGELSLGQLLLFRHWGDAYLVGFTTFSGVVAAASQWDAPMENKKLIPALEGSYEQIFHDTDIKAFILGFDEFSGIPEFFKKEHLQRAVGAIYTPETERFSHYFKARIADQFNTVIHFDVTNPVTPL